MLATDWVYLGVLKIYHQFCAHPTVATEASERSNPFCLPLRPPRGLATELRGLVFLGLKAWILLISENRPHFVITKAIFARQNTFAAGTVMKHRITNSSGEKQDYASTDGRTKTKRTKAISGNCQTERTGITTTATRIFSSYQRLIFFPFLAPFPSSGLFRCLVRLCAGRINSTAKMSCLCVRPIWIL